MAQATRILSSIPPLSILRSSEKCHYPSMATFSTFCPPNPLSLSRPSSIFHHRCFLKTIKSLSGRSDVRGSFRGSIGFLGLGIMGTPMAINLCNAGLKLPVGQMELHLELVQERVDVATSKLISKKIKENGGLFLEAPVSGSKKPAEDGQLIFLAAGDLSLYETVSELLDVMGKSKYFLGEVGNGAAMKLIVNMIMGSMMASFSEGILLSRKAGLDPDILIKVLSEGAISAPMFSMKGPSMAKSTYPTAFPLKHQQKDMRLALGLADTFSQSMPVAAAANELYKAAKAQGLSDQDFSAVIEALKSELARS